MEPVQIANAIKELCSMSIKLSEFENDHAKFLDIIKSLDRGYLEREKSKLADNSINYKGILNPVNFAKYVIIDKILANQSVDVALLDEIQRNITAINTDYFRDYPDFKEPMLRQERKDFFHSWTNFTILFYVYYDQHKDEVNSALSDIAEHLKTRLNLPDTKATINGFGWNHNYGGSTCWLALYPADRKGHKESYQIYMGIEVDNKVAYGVETGSKLEHKVREVDEQDGVDLDIRKLEDYLYTESKPKYERLNGLVEPNGNGKVDSQSPKNLILYGPPGTGKTYKAFEMAVNIVESSFKWDKRDQLIQKFKQLQEQERIKFITFHQSYSYEEFVEGYRYNEQAQIPLVEPGIFQTLVEIARTDYESPTRNVRLDLGKVNVFKMSLGNTLQGDDDIYEYCIRENVIGLGWGDDVDYSSAKDRESVAELYEKKYADAEDKAFTITEVHYFKNYIKKGDLIFVSRGNRALRAIGRITGEYFYDPNSPIEYNHFRKVEWFLVDKNIPVEKIMKKNFSQQSLYELSKNQLIESNIRDLLTEIDRKEIGNYVLIIDEINRGNISKIFGELITLIEDDKRLDMENEMTVTLPYSKMSRFGIPPNIHIIGTMNTADRSIALMDVALRRRFRFHEEMPDAKVITGILGEKEIDSELIEIIEKTFTILNKRVEVLLDRDHTIGHSYFLNLSAESAESDLFDVWCNEIIPLLQEYFYNDWDKLKLILGESDGQNHRGFVQTLEEDYRGIFVNEYEDEYPCKIMVYDRDDFLDVLNNTFVRFGDESTE